MALFVHETKTMRPSLVTFSFSLISYLSGLKQMLRRSSLRFLPEPSENAAKGAWIVPLWHQVTKGQYDVEDFGVYDLPAKPEIAVLFQ